MNTAVLSAANSPTGQTECLDLSPLTVSTLANLPLRFHPSLELTPWLDEENPPYLRVAEPNLHLDVFALTREQLLAEVEEQLAMLWQEYALADDADLDDEALRLKTTLNKSLNSLL